MSIFEFIQKYLIDRKEYVVLTIYERIFLALVFWQCIRSHLYLGQILGRVETEKEKKCLLIYFKLYYRLRMMPSTLIAKTILAKYDRRISPLPKKVRIVKRTEFGHFINALPYLILDRTFCHVDYWRLQRFIIVFDIYLRHIDRLLNNEIDHNDLCEIMIVSKHLTKYRYFLEGDGLRFRARKWIKRVEHFSWRYPDEFMSIGDIMKMSKAFWFYI